MSENVFLKYIWFTDPSGFIAGGDSTNTVQDNTFNIDISNLIFNILNPNGGDDEATSFSTDYMQFGKSKIPNGVDNPDLLEQSKSKLKKRDNSAQGNGENIGKTVIGTSAAIAKELYYSKKYGTWMGKNFKMYQQTWGGNGFTGGKLKFGKKVSTGFKIGGYGLGIWNAYKIDQQNRSGQITDGQMYMEQGSNLFTTIGGIYGAAWGIGWEAGRAITNTGWYQEAKFNFWYNRWENQVGSPSQSNEALWYYFYQNYKP